MKAIHSSRHKLTVKIPHTKFLSHPSDSGNPPDPPEEESELDSGNPPDPSEEESELDLGNRPSPKTNELYKIITSAYRYALRSHIQHNMTFTNCCHVIQRFGQVIPIFIKYNIQISLKNLITFINITANCLSIFTTYNDLNWNSYITYIKINNLDTDIKKLRRLNSGKIVKISPKLKKEIETTVTDEKPQVQTLLDIKIHKARLITFIETMFNTNFTECLTFIYILSNEHDIRKIADKIELMTDENTSAFFTRSPESISDDIISFVFARRGFIQHYLNYSKSYNPIIRKQMWKLTTAWAAGEFNSYLISVYIEAYLILLFQNSITNPTNTTIMEKFRNGIYIIPTNIQGIFELSPTPEIMNIEINFINVIQMYKAKIEESIAKIEELDEIDIEYPNVLFFAWFMHVFMLHDGKDTFLDYDMTKYEDSIDAKKAKDISHHVHDFKINKIETIVSYCIDLLSSRPVNLYLMKGCTDKTYSESLDFLIKGFYDNGVFKTQRNLTRKSTRIRNITRKGKSA